MRVALFAWVFVSLWPFASTMSMYTIDAAGWLFLAIGWGLAEAGAAPVARRLPLREGVAGEVGA